MRMALAALVCLLAALSATAQSTNGEKSATPDVSVTLARQEKDGTISDDREKFGPGDVPLYCYVDLSSDKAVNVKMVIVAVKAVGLRPESAFITVSYKTKEGDTQVSFTAKPAKLWPTGSYRVDIYLDGSKAGSRTFTVTGK